MRKAREDGFIDEMVRPDAGRPADECPYPKPFPADFDDCPAFRADEFIALDMHYRPLRAVRTCHHLVRGTVHGGGPRAYARCLLGTAEDRARWVERVRPERLQVVAEVGAQLREAVRPHIQAMWEAKGALLAGSVDPGTRARLEVEIDAVIADCDRLIDRNQARLAEVGLPAAPVKELVRRALTDWRQSSERVYRLELSEEILSWFPAEVRELLQPGQV